MWFNRVMRAYFQIWGVYESGEPLKRAAYGLRDVEHSLPMELDTQSRIASMTKSFAAVACLLARDEGLLDLDVALHELGLPLKLSASLGRLTCRHLLTMSANLPTDDPWGDRELPDTNEQFDALFEQEVLCNVEVASYSYSNLGFMLLGRVLALAAKRSFMEYVNEKILRPLAMNDTTWHPIHAARGYKGIPYVVMEDAQCNGDGVSFAGLYSTIDDMAKWAHFLAHPNSILRESSRLELATGRTAMPPHDLEFSLEIANELIGQTSVVQEAWYAMGLRCYQIAMQRHVGHSGGLPGYASHFRFSGDLSIVVLANST